MLDSSYTVASNPNTMRDQGPWRNAEYNFTPSTNQDNLCGFDKTGQSFVPWQSPQEARKQSVKSKGNKSLQGVLDNKNNLEF